MMLCNARQKVRERLRMIFSDFVESVVETPICCELKQQLDKWYEFYTKNPEKCMEKMSMRGSTKTICFLHLLLLMELYKSEGK